MIGAANESHMKTKVHRKVDGPKGFQRVLFASLTSGRCPCLIKLVSKAWSTSFCKNFGSALVSWIDQILDNSPCWVSKLAKSLLFQLRRRQALSGLCGFLFFTHIVFILSFVSAWLARKYCTVSGEQVIPFCLRHHEYHSVILALGKPFQVRW